MLVDELADAGARLFEVTFDDEAAADAVRASTDRLAHRREGPFFVGAGTIRTEEHLRAASRAEAAFGVSPTFNRAVLEAAVNAQLPFIPGAATPTEVELAWQIGSALLHANADERRALVAGVREAVPREESSGPDLRTGGPGPEA